MSELRVEYNKYDPATNTEAISLMRQPDGNWIGEMQRFGSLVSVRDISPETVLQHLLTHEGKTN